MMQCEVGEIAYRRIITRNYVIRFCFAFWRSSSQNVELKDQLRPVLHEAVHEFQDGLVSFFVQQQVVVIALALQLFPLFGPRAVRSFDVDALQFGFPALDAIIQRVKVPVVNQLQLAWVLAVTQTVKDRKIS